ncbi:MAG: hypothetical protein D0528_11365 [Methylococcales bacterium]|nr:MAG: hypothetical protein D0528_11365 [Methylococcales bacterium]
MCKAGGLGRETAGLLCKAGGFGIETHGSLCKAGGLGRETGILHLPVYTLCNSWLYKVMKTGFFRCTNEHKPSVHCTMKVYIHAISQSR